MKTRSVSNIARLSMCALMIGGSLFAASPNLQPCAPTTVSEDWNYPAEASRLLKEVQSTATRLTSDTGVLFHSQPGLSRATHVRRLDQAKDHINTMGASLNRLREIRRVAEPWQQQAIDAVVPVAVDLAASTQAAILHLNEQPHRLWAPAYTSHLRAIADHADRLKDYVDLHLELASTQDKLEELRLRTLSLGS